jgi:hypothetical protein
MDPVQAGKYAKERVGRFLLQAAAAHGYRNTLEHLLLKYHLHWALSEHSDSGLSTPLAIAMRQKQYEVATFLLTETNVPFFEQGNVLTLTPRFGAFVFL